MIELEEQIACVRREIAMRERLYPHYIARKGMTQQKANRELEAMRAVLKTLLAAAGDSAGRIR